MTDILVVTTLKTVSLKEVETLVPVSEAKFMHVLFDCGIASAVSLIQVGDIVQNVFTDTTNKTVGMSYKTDNAWEGEVLHHYLADWLVTP